METILKFIGSSTPTDDSKHRNDLTSRTLLKVAFIDRYWLQDAKKQGLRTPRMDEMWRCEISRETRMGQNTGVFLVKPIHVVNPADLIKLVPGMYTSNFVSGRLIITPKPEYQNENHAFIMPLYMRQHLADDYGAYAVIVMLTSAPQEIRPKVFG